MSEYVFFLARIFANKDRVVNVTLSLKGKILGRREKNRILVYFTQVYSPKVFKKLVVEKDSPNSDDCHWLLRRGPKSFQSKKTQTGLEVWWKTRKEWIYSKNICKCHKILGRKCKKLFPTRLSIQFDNY